MPLSFSLQVQTGVQGVWGEIRCPPCDDKCSPAARGGNLAKIPPNQVIADFGRGSSVESESE